MPPLKNNNFLFAITALAATFVACEKNELSILTFNSEDDFYSTVENIRKMEYSNVKTRSVLQNFKSIYDEYDEEMSVADDSLSDIIRFESKETYADFTAVYPANLKDILKLNNGDGFWETFSAKFKKALEQYAAKYGSHYLTEFWNNNIND